MDFEVSKENLFQVFDAVDQIIAADVDQLLPGPESVGDAAGEYPGVPSGLDVDAAVADDDRLFGSRAAGFEKVVDDVGGRFLGELE